jgi:hypothetical protein
VILHIKYTERRENDFNVYAMPRLRSAGLTLIRRCHRRAGKRTRPHECRHLPPLGSQIVVSNGPGHARGAVPLGEGWLQRRAGGATTGCNTARAVKSGGPNRGRRMPRQPGAAAGASGGTGRHTRVRAGASPGRAQLVAHHLYYQPIVAWARLTT